MNHGAAAHATHRPWFGVSSGERRLTAGQLSLSGETEEDVGG